jgi:hypothetical protein
MDVQVRHAVTRGLRRRGVDVVTAQEDGSSRLSDSLLLDRASALGRAIFSQDDDMLAKRVVGKSVVSRLPASSTPISFASRQGKPCAIWS